jgi:hypothetical protein
MNSRNKLKAEYAAVKMLVEKEMDERQSRFEYAPEAIRQHKVEEMRKVLAVLEKWYAALKPGAEERPQRRPPSQKQRFEPPVGVPK